MAEESLEIKSLAELRRWLERNHGRGEGVWLVTYKKHVPEKHVAWDDVVDELLCFGWIDSKPGKVDANRSRLWIAPRKPGSAWSRLNKNKVAALARAKRLHASGRARIEAAKKDGSWTFLDDVEDLIVPDDLGAALNARPKARENFDGFPRSVRRGILEWIKQAKKPETRARRIEEMATRAAKGERANQFVRK